MSPDISSLRPTSPSAGGASTTPTAATSTSSPHHISPAHRAVAASPVSPRAAPLLDEYGMSTAMPTRHPRPITPAELHQEFEKEQEAAVNRLTRELTALRSRSASNTSASDAQHLSSSTFISHPSPEIPHHPAAISTSTTDPAHPQSFPGPPPRRPSNRTPRTSYGSAGIPVGHGHSSTSRPTSSAGGASVAAASVTGSGLGSGSGSASGINTLSTPRYEEVADRRREWEAARAENEALRGRVRALEEEVRGRSGQGTSS